MKTFGWEMTVLPGAVAVAGLLALGFWVNTGVPEGILPRVPGLDQKPRFVLSTPAEGKAIPRAGQPQFFDGKPSAIAESWPCFRGARRDNICADSTRLAQRWPPEGPKVLWTANMLGPGHAGAAVARGRVYVLDYDVQLQADTLRCFSLDDGKEIWRNGYPVAVSENHGMSRTVPAVFEDCVVTLGPQCHVACWDAETGKCRWLVDLVAQCHTKVPAWYAGQCPLVDDGRVIVAPAGDVFMMALDCRSGKTLWETPKVRNWEMTHVSIAPVDFGGRRMYVYCGSGGVAGMSADDGKVLWETTAWVGKMATCPTPVPIGDGRIFLCSGYSAGSLMLRLNDKSGQIVPEALWRLKARQFESEQHTPIFYANHLFGVRTAAGGGEQLVCMDMDGKIVWTSGRSKFGRGPYLVANGLIYAMSDDGLLTMAEAGPAAYHPLGQFQVFDDGVDAWAPMAVAAGRLVLRDLTRMACIDLAEK